MAHALRTCVLAITVLAITATDLDPSQYELTKEPAKQAPERKVSAGWTTKSGDEPHAPAAAATSSRQKPDDIPHPGALPSNVAMVTSAPDDDGPVVSAQQQPENTQDSASGSTASLTSDIPIPAPPSLVTPENVAQPDTATRGDTVVNTLSAAKNAVMETVGIKVTPAHSTTGEKLSSDVGLVAQAPAEGAMVVLTRLGDADSSQKQSPQDSGARAYGSPSSFPQPLAAPPKESKAQDMPPLLWFAPFFSGTGFGSEARSFALMLDGKVPELAIRHYAEGESDEFKGQQEGPGNTLHRLREREVPVDSGTAVVCQSMPYLWKTTGECPPANSGYSIGRSMFETDALPSGWAERCNLMDEVWVPSKFHIESFTKAGVRPDKLQVIPEAVETESEFNPALVARPYPLPQPSMVTHSINAIQTNEQLNYLLSSALQTESAYLPTGSGQNAAVPQAQELVSTATSTQAASGQVFKFLSIGKWEKRKGFDVLLRAYCQEFRPDEPVALYIKTSKHVEDPAIGLQRLVREECQGLPLSQLPKIVLIDERIPEKELPSLYSAADAFVAPSRGEGWGRPQAEAMAMGLPTIATDWGGTSEFINEDVALPIRVAQLVELSTSDQASLKPPGPGGFLHGHRYAEPDTAHLRERMRWVYGNRGDNAVALGKRARDHMRMYFSPTAVSDIITHRLQIIRSKQSLTSCALELDAHVASAAGAWSSDGMSVWSKMMTSLEEVAKSFHVFVETGHADTVGASAEAVAPLLL